jgi:histidyl-tRNA synthetase
MGKIVPRLFKGTRDFLPRDMRQRERVAGIFRSIFLRYGYEPLETPAIERYDLLTGKYGEDAEKLIYRLAYKGGRELALRYDLTVPLARVVAMYPELGLPFKRYQMQPVWRADRHSSRQGRYREFIQCDADCVGSASILADAELIAILYEAFRQLGFGAVRIRLNDRQLLSGIILGSGVAEGMEDEVCRSIDKLEKIGAEGVLAELEAKGIGGPASREILRLLDLPGDRHERSAQLKQAVGSRPETLQGLGTIDRLYRLLAPLGVNEEAVSFDPHLARGLDYYSGPIFETVLDDLPHIGSLSGGGRYDGMIGELTGRDLPATGTTLGLDRITTALEQMDRESAAPPASDILVTVFDETLAAQSLALATELRRAGGLNVEVYPGEEKLGRQFGYADRKGIPLVAVLGSDELARGVVRIKNLGTGEQHEVARAELASFLRSRAG